MLYGRNQHSTVKQLSSNFFLTEIEIDHKEIENKTKNWETICKVLIAFSCILISIQISSVKSFSCVQLFATPWTAARQASLSITNSWSLLRFMSIESVMPSNHLILCHPLLTHLQSFPASGSFQMSQFFASGGQSIGVWASASVLPVNIQDWFPLGWTGWISLLSRGLSRVFQHHSSKASILKRSAFFIVQLSHPYMSNGKNKKQKQKQKQKKTHSFN